MTAPVHAAVAALLASMEDAGIREGADSGQPFTGYRVLYESGGIEVGVWRSDPGGWPIENRPDTEVISILAGRATLTNSDGSSFQADPGDVFVLPAGWTGRWDVIEPVEKFYVTIEKEKT